MEEQIPTPRPPEGLTPEIQEKAPSRLTPQQGILIGIFVGLIVALLGFALFFGGTQKVVYEPSDQVIDENSQDDSMNEDELNEQDTSSIAFTDYSVQTRGNVVTKNYTKSLDGKEIKIDWLKGAEPLSEEETTKILGKIFTNEVSQINARKEICKLLTENNNNGEYKELPIYCELHIFKAGHLTEPINRELYYVAKKISEMGEFWDTFLAAWDNDLNQFLVLHKDTEGELSLYSDYHTKMFAGYFDVSLPELEAPQFIELPNQKSKLKFEKFLSKNISSFFTYPGTPDNMGGIVDVENKIIANSYFKDAATFIDETYGPVYFRDGGYHIVMPDGSVAIYDLLPYFFTTENENANKKFYTEGYVADINFYGNRNGFDLYELSGTVVQGGCFSGIKPCTNIVTNEPWFYTEKLRLIGETNNGGEKIYALDLGGPGERKENKYYRELFDYGYTASKIFSENSDALENLSPEQQWEDFLSDEPIFFWEDPNGNWRVYKKHKYRSSAECGKPVIYLYPEENMEVNVQVKPNGGFTITEPEYGQEGWNVLAKPNGELSLLDDSVQTKYPYLFWEGHGINYERPEYGFVMSSKEVPERMNKILGQLGLNEKETSDFMEFWQPKLQAAPYVFVTFLEQSKFDELAPLTVTPQPDNVIRVFMDYELLDSPREVTEPNIITPERTGFTVVEWGGALQN